VVVTGANRGIGLAFVQHYADMPGVTVIAGCREPKYASELAVLRNVRVEELDVASDASVASFAKAVGEAGHVDLLINNAGLLYRDDIGDANLIENARQQLDVNCLGPLRVTQALWPMLEKTPGSKVVNITSRMGSIADNSSGKYYGYRASKAALNAITMSMARDFTGHPVIVLHPGMIKTGMTGGQGDMDATEAVSRMTKIIDKITTADSGKFFHRDGQELPW